jgi:hypothetical protein
MNTPTAQIKTATRQLVDSLLEMNTNNRAVKKTVVECYKQDIADGRWYLTNQGIGVDINGALLDGQHRLIAIKESGYPPVPLLIVSGLQVEAQSAIDQHAKRSVRDIWRLVLDMEVSGKAPAICTIIYKVNNGWNGGKISAQRLKDVLDEYVDQIQFVLEAMGNSKVLAAPYLAAFAVAAKEFPERWADIVAFIHRVASGENLNKKMPEFHLRNLIISSRAVNSGPGGSLQYERFHKAYKALTCSLKGEEIGVLRV